MVANRDGGCLSLTTIMHVCCLRTWLLILDLGLNSLMILNLSRFRVKMSCRSSGSSNLHAKDFEPMMKKPPRPLSQVSEKVRMFASVFKMLLELLLMLPSLIMSTISIRKSKYLLSVKSKFLHPCQWHLLRPK